MVIGNILSLFTFGFYILIFTLISYYIKEIVKLKGFSVYSVFLIIFTVFYIMVPFIQTFFPKFRDDSTHFTILLNQQSSTEIFWNMIVSFFILCIIVAVYHIDFRKNRKKRERNDFLDFIKNKRKNHFKTTKLFTDIVFILGATSILLLIIETGSLQTYLSLGSQTRGLDKEPTDYIRSSYLQLITLSLVILVVPYMYFYLYKLKKSQITLMKLIISIVFAILFLLYNQGRAPLLLFFVPFFFVFGNKKSKANLFLLAFLAVIGTFLLSILDRFFNYLAYGVTIAKVETNFLTQFLKEFSYPFSNFVLKGEFVDITGFRYLYDYIIWPFTMIPGSILSLIGFDKNKIDSIYLVNTSNYEALLGAKASGGIPVDFLTYNYYQFGYISLIILAIFFGIILKQLDIIFQSYKYNIPIQIILYRISFSMINVINNFDMSAIFRNRLDIIILLGFVLTLYYHDLRMFKKTKLRHKSRYEKIMRV
ncbi:oligosaccharide repeat unit polymerase [Planococcus wigleyi]|uniref:Oligosaccharide repeat unit polymerase n=1 Tax=Planococcus wigleyi TaxID=2762216 RepID=A0ABR8W8M4_9BACL|nr:oligosaccharide repeat unit polymerase [Planococcus wigleyi]MBD8013367.1 oligosaccharide repeat unit polymerase [Planococcus wigleyi]